MPGRGEGRAKGRGKGRGKGRDDGGGAGDGAGGGAGDGGADAASLIELADRLYGLAPADFTASRDALVREHRADKSFAASIKAWPKPPVAAFVVNLLVRREHDQVAQVLAVGESLREAAAALDGDELRALTRQRRQLTAAVTSIARSVAADEGVRVSESVADQVEATLTAAMLDPNAASAVRSGMLIKPLRATGAEEVDVASAVALPEALGFAAPARPRPRPDLKVVPEPEGPDKDLVREAREALATATRAREAAVRAADRARARVGTVQARVLQAEAEVAEVRRRLAEVEAEAEGAAEELSSAEEDAAEAEQARTEAESAVNGAQAALDDLIGG